MHNLLVAGNPTMPSAVGIWNLPALNTCTPSPWCQEHCYACKGRFIWNIVQNSLIWRYRFSLRSDFVQEMVEEINKRRSIKYVRIHISGDFYDETYVNKWAAVARQLPNILFRTNTRRQDLLKHIMLVFPRNVIVSSKIR